MKVAIVQMAVEQGEFEKNIAKTEAFAKRAHECGADIAVFPEMFLCGLENKNSQDFDIAAFTYNDAKYIRKEIQVNNENLYFLYIYFNLFSNNLKELEYLINKIEGISSSIGIQTRKANFRQEQLFLSCIPIMENNQDIKIASRRNILTNGLLATYPFVSSSIFDENGIYIGNNIYNNSLVFIDRYNTEKYKNANICVFGTSGSR